ncbi:aldehyde dehydrogenase family protein [Paralcaligenes sp. KSB-10]|uniref:aldehyde dehydrogenase family protein n=1 Tax=Paralcaligenes sp. KSB-10 TaxID=2901142 RepID=UPI001E49B117|nr:aldehyde dehydrogenase family protein [Paralcaligenes sp. KSB-10]UHL64237.1 aldehyde dehydrogenase family protein [Paralcaligenes sp. KSB-10]
MSYKQHFINGAWVDAQGVGQTIIYDSSTEASIGTVCHAIDAEVNGAVAAARAAFAPWANLPIETRARYVRAIAEGLESHADALVAGIVAEVGMPEKLTRRIQVQAPIAAWRATADAAIDALAETKTAHSYIMRVPVGVVGAITPWNYPLHQITGKLAAALVAGCTIVLKPSDLAPTSAQILGKAIETAKLPEGVVNIIFGDGATGEALVAHPGVNMVSFTGSTAVGRRIASSAGQALKRVSLELGGKSASIALAEADPALVVRHALSSCFLNSGQTCSAITRLIVPEDQYLEYRTRLQEGAQKITLGDPRDSATRMGPLVSSDQRQRVLSFLLEAEEAGFDLIAGGTHAPTPGQGYFIAPTVFGRVPAQARIASEEIFGPVLAVLTYVTEDEAINIANQTPYGLAGAVWGSEDKAMAAARQLRAGQIDVNGAPFNPLAPFGGFGASGIGREGGIYGILEFTELRAIQASSTTTAQ